MKARFYFGDIVVVDNRFVGIVVKSWLNESRKVLNHDVYIRSFNVIKEYKESDIKRLVYDKELSEEDTMFNVA